MAKARSFSGIVSHLVQVITYTHIKYKIILSCAKKWRTRKRDISVDFDS